MVMPRGTQKDMRVIVPLKNAHDFAFSAVEEREMLGTWPGESFFILHSKVNPTVLTECAVAT
jgi:hypothetical protein